MREPPITAFRGWVDGLGSGFGVMGFMATPSVWVFLTFAAGWLLAWLSFLVLFRAAQSARSGINFIRTICS